MYRYIKAIAAMAISAALFLASRPCVYANNDYLAYTNPETEMEATSSTTTVTVDYVGNYVYENGTLTKILFEGGYVDMTGSTPKYMYYLTDHLGNVRVVADSEGNIAQVNHYYPYGDRFSDNRYALSSSSTSNNDRLFGGKELDSSSGLHDFEARYDNTMFGRFTTIDPMAEKYYGISPYAYCAGNPINIIDPSGQIWEDIKEIYDIIDKVNIRIQYLDNLIHGLSSKQNLDYERQGYLLDFIEQRDILYGSLNDISVLSQDKEHIYSIKYVDPYAEHHVTSADNFNVKIETSTVALALHEITHMRQAIESNNIKFIDGLLMNPGYRLGSSPNKKMFEEYAKNEIEAYKTQYSMDSTFPGILEGFGINGITIHSVGAIKKADGVTPAYTIIKALDRQLYLDNLIKK